VPGLGLPVEGRHHLSRLDRQPERQAAELDRQAVPQRGPAQHRVLAAENLDRGRPGDRTGALGVGPGFLGTRDVVSGPVCEQDPATGQLVDRLRRRQPGRQPGDGRHRRVPGRQERRPRAHRMADQHDGNAAEPRADLVEHLGQVLHRRGQLAVPAPYPVVRPLHHDAAAAEPVPDGERERDHPQHGRVQRANRVGADLGAAVRHDHRPANAGRGRCARAPDRLAAHRLPSPLASRSLSASIRRMRGEAHRAGRQSSSRWAARSRSAAAAGWAASDRVGADRDGQAAVGQAENAEGATARRRQGVVRGDHGQQRLIGQQRLESGSVGCQVALGGEGHIQIALGHVGDEFLPGPGGDHHGHVGEDASELAQQAGQVQ
jgi:hypothetical protein